MAKRRRRWRLLYGFLLTGVLLYAWAGWFEPSFLEVTRHRVPLRIERPITLVHLTDVHTNGFWRKERGVAARLAELSPDVIVLTGDTLHQGGVFEECRPFLERLAAPLGVFMVSGNWETACKNRLPRGMNLREFLASCGVRLLQNESAEIAPGLFLIGLDDYVWGVPDLERATRGIPAGAARVALIHEPGFFDEPAGTDGPGYDLLLAGHTHGGQVRVPFLPPLYLPAGCSHYVEGWYERPGARLYVSRGIGMSGPKFRFLCRPELAVHQLVPLAQ